MRHVAALGLLSAAITRIGYAGQQFVGLSYAFLNDGVARAA
jgi:hypothetical protein